MADRLSAGTPRVPAPDPGDALFREGDRFHLHCRRRWVIADDLPSRGKVAVPGMNSGGGPCYCCDSNHVRPRRNRGRKPRTHRDRR